MNIEEHPFLARIPKKEAKKLIAYGRQIDCPQGAVIFEENSESDSIFLVLEGTVQFSKRIKGGKQRVLSTMKAGSFFGELGILSGDPRALRATALTPTSVFRIPGKAVIKFISDTSETLSEIMQNIIRHLHDTTDRYMADIIQKEKKGLVGDLANTILQEMRNPFSVIKMSTHILRRKHQDPDSQRLYQQIEEQIDQMGNMVDDLLAFSRGSLDLTRKRIDIGECFARFIEMQSAYFKQHNVTITYEADRVFADVDEKKFGRLLQILTSNAVEAMAEGRPGLIKLTAKRSTGAVIVQVADNGNGIPDHIAEHIFQPFVEGDHHDRTGLGTAIARSIVEAHGGEISYETNAGEGTTFRIKLPG